MTNRPKNIGTAAESSVVNFLRGNGFPHAERRALHGSTDCGDVTGCGPICIEVKGGHAAETASDGLIATWLAETEVERVNSLADLGILVVKRKGIGHSNAGQWWAIIPADDIRALLNQQYPVRNPIRPTRFPTRMHLTYAVLLVRAAGYGDPLETVTQQGVPA